MRNAPDDAEIVNGDGGVQRGDERLHFAVQRIGAGIADDNGVKVNDHVDTEVTAEIALDVIDEIVADENVIFGIDLTMGRGKTAAHAVIVHSKVMHADDAGVREHFLGNGLYEFALRRLAEERIRGADCKLHAGEHDKQRNRRAHVAVQIHAGEHGDDGAEQHDACGDDIVAAVLGRGFDGLGFDHAADLAVKEALPELCQNGNDEHNEGDGREGVFLRREDFLNGRHAELKPEENDDERDDDARKILDARVAERVLFIRRLTCHFKADERDNGRAGICEVVDGIGRDGNTVKNRADDNLH